MKRRTFMALMALSTTLLSAIDLTKLKPSVWKARKLNEAALELYGQKKFATLQKSEAIVIEAEKAIVRDAQQIPIRFKTEIEAQSVALFQTGNDQSLVAVFNIEEGMIIDYELNIRMERKGTFFVVVEGIDNRLYYKRHFIDVSSFRCVA